MRKIKREDKEKILAIIIFFCGHILILSLLFECLFINTNLKMEYPACKYSSYTFMEAIFHPFFEQAAGNDSEFVLMFRWNYNDMIEGMKSTVYLILEVLMEKNQISDYKVDEQTMTVDITVNKMTKSMRDNFNYKLDEVKDTCSLWYIFTYKKLPAKSLAEVTLYDKSGKQIHDIEVVLPAELEKEREKEAALQNVYNEEDKKCLERILSCSKNKKTFDFNNESKVKGDTKNERGGHIRYLDLSDYSDITGKLDLTGFPKLQYVLLRRMKISEVLLPESLERIDEKSFAYCERLEKITLPKGVKSIDNPIFYGCKNLKEITFEGDAPEVSWNNEDVFGKVPEDLVIYRKKSAKGWQEICWDKYDVRIID